jgi:hypothetical protein
MVGFADNIGDVELTFRIFINMTITAQITAITIFPKHPLGQGVEDQLQQILRSSESQRCVARPVALDLG